MKNPERSLPSRVSVVRVIEPRYTARETESPGVVPYRTELIFGLTETRPLDWDARRAGIDIVELSDGSTVKLRSDGGQSMPKPGWTILLRDGDDSAGFSWTLYGIPHGVIPTAAILKGA